MVGRDIDMTGRHVPSTTIGDVILEIEGLSAVGDRGEEALKAVLSQAADQVPESSLSTRALLMQSLNSR